MYIQNTKSCGDNIKTRMLKFVDNIEARTGKTVLEHMYGYEYLCVKRNFTFKV